MPHRKPIAAALVESGMLTVAQAKAIRATGDDGAPMTTLLDWVEGYLMRSHADLGRSGAVCPFTRQAARLDLVRLAICRASPNDEEPAFTLIRSAFRTLADIEAKPGMAHFRTVIVGFPDCATPDGVAMLQRIQKRHKFHALARNRMIGLMHAQSEAPGLWNPAFRPLRAPFPVLAIRQMVEQDAPFAARHPLLLLPYLARFPVSGARRLYAHFRAGA